jgi:SNF2 family DNA or RNA helicase
MLKKIGSMLTAQKINIVFCNGTVYQKKRAISSFCKDNTINIILLSSRNAASGINLTEANKIILLEPIYGSKEYRYNIESQAVGRADRLGQKRPIDIHRFIIQNTVEEDILNNCVDDAKLKQLSLN